MLLKLSKFTLFVMPNKNLFSDSMLDLLIYSTCRVLIYASLH